MAAHLSVSEALRTLPTSTAHQARLQLYQPTRRPVWAERVIDTVWGSAVIRGKIGQVHADIIEAFCRHAEDYRTIEATGHLQLLVDPYKVRTCIGGGSAYAKDTLWQMLTELREASITLSVPSLGLRVLGGILDRVEESRATKINPLTGQARPMWRITLDPAFAAMMQGDLALHYDPAQLARISCGVAQAIARLVLTHRDQPSGGWHLDGLITLVGAAVNPSALRNRRRDVKNCAEELKAVGVEVLDGRVFRCKPASDDAIA